MTGIAVGSEEQDRIFGGYSTIAEEFQAALRSGINFFELRAEKPIMFARQIQGPFTVRVTEEFVSALNKSRFNTTWITGERANVRFEVLNPKTGLAKAYLPDDPFWHNRVIIADNPNLQHIAAYHTRDGMYPGTGLREEINELWRAMTVEITEYTVVNAQGRMIGSFPTRKEAEKDIQDNKYKNYVVRNRLVRVKSPEILHLISNWHRSPESSLYGWTDCKEFKVIKERVKAIVKERRAAANQPSIGPIDPSMLKSAFIEVIKGMSIEERRALLRETTEGQQREQIFNGKQPRFLPIGELRKRAKELGVKLPKTASRKDIIAALRQKGENIIDEQAENTKKEQSAAPSPAVEEVVTE
jgi:hypothetical protein